MKLITANSDTTLDQLFKPFAICDQQAIACPWPIFDKIREAEQPVFYSETLGAWVLVNRKDVVSALADPITWSNKSVGSSGKGVQAFLHHLNDLKREPEMAVAIADYIETRRGGEVLITADPPIHKLQRRALDRVFRPHRINQLEPEIQAISDHLIASLRPEGKADLVEDYAVMLPITILARAFAVPEADRKTFKRWGDALGVRLGRANLSREDVREIVLAEREFREYFAPLLEERAENPGDDLISDIATAEVDGELLNHATRLEALQQFVIAGHETTSTSIANIAYKLATDHNLADRLRADRSLVPHFVEEMLRHQTPFLGFFRVALKDTEIAGVPIAEGDHVWISYAGANRDPEHCPVPHEFDLDRTPNHHLSFGMGEHNCMGAPLARLQSKVAANALLDLPNLSLAEGYQPRFSDSYLLRSLIELPVTFDV